MPPLSPEETRIADYPWAGDPAAHLCEAARLGFLPDVAPDLVSGASTLPDAATLIAAAGIAAGRAARETLLDHACLDDLTEASTKSGDVFRFGGSVMRTIFPDNPGDAPIRLWPVAAGAAVAAGLDPAYLPHPEDLVGAVARIIGSHCPTVSLAPDRWPAFDFDALENKIDRAYNKIFLPLPILWRAAVAAHNASLTISALGPTFSALGPAYGLHDALTAVAEAAIYAAKRGSPIGAQPHPMVRL